MSAAEEGIRAHNAEAARRRELGSRAVDDAPAVRLTDAEVVGLWYCVQHARRAARALATWHVENAAAAMRRLDPAWRNAPGTDGRPSEDAQLVVLSLALTSLLRPGFYQALRDVAERMGGSDWTRMLDHFRALNEDAVKPRATTGEVPNEVPNAEGDRA